MPRKPSRKPELAPPPSAAETLVGPTSQSSQTSTQSSQSTLVAPTPSAGVVSRKRPGVQPLQNSQSNKRPRHASAEEEYGVVPACARRSGMVRETADLVLPGELGTTISDPTGTETVPVRYLDAFAVFDPRTGELLDLSEVEKENDYQFEAAGYTWPVVVEDDDGDDEEEEDDDDEQEEDSEADTDNDNGPSASQPGEGMMPARPYVHLSAIMTVWFHPQPGPDGDSRIWIQTSFAWYILRAPSLEYTSMYLSFLVPRRITQLVLAHTELSREVFTEEHLTKTKEYGHCFSEADLTAAVPLIKEEAPEIDAGLLSTPLVAELVGRRPSRSKSRTPRAPRARRASRAQPPQQRKRSGGANLETRARDAQSTSQVLPRVARLARRHVVGSLTILGTPGSADDASRVCILDVEDQTHACNDAACPVFAARKEHGIVVRALERFHDRRSTKASTEIDARTVRIHDKTYSIGDTVLLPRTKGKDMPTRASLGAHLIVPEDCFHLAQILFFDADKGRAHVRLYVAARETVLDELAGPREVMLTDECASVRTRDICGSLPIVADGRDAKPGVRRLRYAYCEESGAYADVGPEDFCGQPNAGPCCKLRAHVDQKRSPETYRSGDYVLYRAESGPAHIGQVNSIQTETTKVRRVHRARDLPIPHRDACINEYDVHVLKAPPTTILLSDIIRRCHVVSADEYKKLPPSLRASPYTFVDIGRKSGAAKVSEYSTGKKRQWTEEIEQQKGFSRTRPLAVLDLCAGVGAFGSALAEGSGGALKLTHAIELSPSAAKTIEANHDSDVKVYNQCVNTMLRYAVHVHGGKNSGAPMQLWDHKTPVPSPPLPGDVQVITAGFPCQSFSSLNQHKAQDDARSNIFLNVLSWVEYLKPTYVYLENVRGFVDHKVLDGSGGLIASGSLKLCVRALTELGYQTRFGLLQAAHYGTPQDRVRFFLVAAKRGHTLPALPQPTHDIAGLPVTCQKTTWNFRLSERSMKLRSTDVRKGRAPHYAVTIGDAIGDLKRFHWNITPDKDPRDNIPKVKVDAQKRIIGYTDVARAYEWEPRNAFQAAARRNGKFHDMQHYTRVYEAENSKCVVNIPMLPNADARHLSRNYHTYMLHNPISANAQGGYNKAYFGRLDEQGIFMTVSTNIGPKAKQSRCLNPWCRRLVTVRELARAQGFPDSFVFKSVKGEYDVETMHKQIGNALAWPVAVALGRELRHAMLKDWIRKREDAIVID